MKYEIILYWSEEDHAYIAEVPELAGCMADGPTAGEALRNVELIETRVGGSHMRKPPARFCMCARISRKNLFSLS